MREPIMRKKIIALIFTLLISQLMSSLVYASNLSTFIDRDTKAKGFDTLNYSNDVYKALANDNLVKDSDQIENTIIGYLATEKAYVRSPASYSQSIGYVIDKAHKSTTIAYRESESEYLKELNKLMGWTIYKDNLSFSDFKVTIGKQFAQASIVEDYQYFIDDDFGEESFRRRKYSFEMVNSSDGWKIKEVKTNDPWENDESFSYKEIEVVDIIAKLADDMRLANNKSIKKVTTSDIFENNDNATTSLYRWGYSPSNAVTYASNHFRDTSHPVFGYTPNNNCQNFVSQCVWAGLWGSGTSPAARPAVSPAIAGTNGKNVWQRNVATTYYSPNTYWLNWTWDNTCGFANMINGSQNTLEGPYGFTQYSGYFSYINTGNVLEVDWEGSPARDTLDHAMFVTQVSGTAGSRTTSQVKIAAHTDATNSAYQTLSSYTTMPSSAFTRVVISYGYYAVQP